MSELKDIILTGVVVLLCACLIGIPMWLGCYASTHATSECTVYLAEIENDVYAYRQIVVSSIPAQNYDIAMFCDENGRQYTVKGHVSTVAYTGRPYATIIRYKIVNADRVTIYAPLQTIRWLDTVSVGRR